MSVKIPTSNSVLENCTIFKNMCGTLAERHQLLHAYLSAGDFFPREVVAERVTNFYQNDYSDKISECIGDQFQPYNTTVTHEVSLKVHFTRNACVFFLIRLKKAL